MVLTLPENEVGTLYRVSIIAILGMALGFLAGLPKLSMRINVKAIGLGLAAYLVILIIQLLIFKLKLSYTLTFYFLAAVLEELGFRFGLQRFLEKITKSAHLAILIQAVIFMIYHYMVYPGYEGVIAAYPLIAGLVLGTAYYYAKDLTAPLIAHVLTNIVW